MTVRTLRPSDAAALAWLHRSVGWGARSSVGWRWLAENPALKAHEAPLGWVVTDDRDRAIACLGNWVQRYRLGGRSLFGATGFNLIVPPSQRGRSRELLNAFLDQPGLFAAWTFNANPLSAPLYGRFGMTPWPATHAVKLAWITDPRACLEGRFWREVVRAAPAVAPHLGERLLNRRLWSSSTPALPPRVSLLTDFADRSRYAHFWAALSSEGRLLADRSPATLRWRLSDPDLARPPLVLAFNRGREITGVAMAAVGKGTVIDPPFLEILDLVALDGETEAVPALVQTLIANSRRLGAAKVRLQVASPRLLRQLGGLADTARREGGWGHCHVRFAPDAPDPALWSPTPYDGDYAVCLRQPRPAKDDGRGTLRPAPAQAAIRAWRQPKMT